MASERNVNVKLTADVAEYVEAMQRAKEATDELGDTLRALGITAEDMPAAIKSVLHFNGTVDSTAPVYNPEAFRRAV